jgi:hypothetical protein
LKQWSTCHELTLTERTTLGLLFGIIINEPEATGNNECVREHYIGVGKQREVMDLEGYLRPISHDRKPTEARPILQEGLY